MFSAFKELTMSWGCKTEIYKKANGIVRNLRGISNCQMNGINRFQSSKGSERNMDWQGLTWEGP